MGDLFPLKKNNNNSPKESHHFGFQKELSQEHALHALFNVLADVEGSGDFLVLCAIDIARAFDSCIFAQILPEAIKKGLILLLLIVSVICMGFGPFQYI